MAVSYPSGKKGAPNLPSVPEPELFARTATSNVRGDRPSLLAIRMEGLVLQGPPMSSYGLE
ncbi:hypothetical protein [uncultured Deinococcus sp.]|uniref:hypothetical protein n=1 Tax=uncultured Deinococcus sp. TaxID=158789 RepID=UPI00258CEA64|nr:hypothetical protein [uncultured Deinococcus sp.]